MLYWYGNTIYTDVTDDATNNVTGLLTSMTAYPGKADLICCRFDIYGSDLSSLKRHLLAQIQTLQKKFCGPAFIYVSFDPEIDVKRVEQEIGHLLNQTQIQMNEERVLIEQSTREILFEKPL